MGISVAAPAAAKTYKKYTHFVYMSAAAEKTLVIVLAETRAWEKTYENFHQNVLVPLGSESGTPADLCVCIGVKPDYNYDNPYYKNAAYRFVYDEPADWADAFNYAEYVERGGKRDDIPAGAAAGAADEPKYNFIPDRNPVFGRLANFYSSTDNIDFLGRFPSMEKILEDPKVLSKNYEEIVYHIPQLRDPTWRYCAYGIKKAEHSNVENYVMDYGINMYKRREPEVSAAAAPPQPRESWRRFLQIKSQFMGGISDHANQHEGSAAILIFFRWFLYKNLVETGAINKYDRFIITRSDYIWRLEHPALDVLAADNIWVPNCETYDGITDRHTVIPRAHMRDYCGLLDAMIGSRADEYFENMKQLAPFNLEKFILFHLKMCGLADKVAFFPYVAFTIRPENVQSRWGHGFIYHAGLQSFIKYVSEDRCSQEYVNEFVEWMKRTPTETDVQLFYKTGGVIPAAVRHYY
jgi:hypothetical protein